MIELEADKSRVEEESSQPDVVSPESVAAASDVALIDDSGAKHLWEQVFLPFLERHGHTNIDAFREDNDALLKRKRHAVQDKMVINRGNS